MPTEGELVNSNNLKTISDKIHRLLSGQDCKFTKDPKGLSSTSRITVQKCVGSIWEGEVLLRVFTSDGVLLIDGGNGSISASICDSGVEITHYEDDGRRIEWQFFI